MVVKFQEIYETKVATTGLPIDGQRREKKFASRDIYINPEFLVCVRADARTLSLIKEGNSEVSVDNVSRIYMHRGQTGIDVAVAGNADAIEQKLKGERGLLKG